MPTLAINGGPSELANPLEHRWPIITHEDEALVLQSLRGREHSYGPNCRAFEDEFALWNGSKFAINTNSGTAALHMCLAAVGCGAGDEVIVPAYSWSSTATCVLHQNSIPVFVDIDPETCALDADQVEAAITAKTRAIVVAHLHGTPANMEMLTTIARAHGLAVIEDACQSHGASVLGKRVGNLGDCGAFSFNERKSLCAGDAGMFVTNNRDLYDAARRFWSFGEDRMPHTDRDFHAYALGWMYRSNDLTAAFGRGQLRKLDTYIKWQKANASRLGRKLDGFDLLRLPTVPHYGDSTFSYYVIRLQLHECDGPLASRRDQFVRALEAEGLGGHIAVWQRYPLPDMTVFRGKNAYGHGCPWSCPYGTRGNSMSTFPVSKRHCHTSFCFNTILRTEPEKAPIDEIAACVTKVAEHTGELWGS